MVATPRNIVLAIAFLLSSWPLCGPGSAAEPLPGPEAGSHGLRTDSAAASGEGGPLLAASGKQRREKAAFPDQSRTLTDGTEPSREPQLRLELGFHAAKITGMATDAEGRIVASAAQDKTVRVLDAKSGKLIRVLRPPIGDEMEGELYAVAVSPDGKIIACAGYTGVEWRERSIYLFDGQTGRLQTRLGGFTDVVVRLAYSKDGRYLAALQHSHHGLLLYRTSDYKLIGHYTGCKERSYGLDFSLPDSNGTSRLVTASYDGYVRLFEARADSLNLMEARKAPGGTRPVSVRFSPDGSLIALGYSNVRRVDVLSGKDLSPLYAPDVTGVNNGYLSVVRWSWDGKSLYAGGNWYGSTDRIGIRKWSDRGRGVYLDITGGGSHIADMVPLPDGSMIFGRYSGSIAALGSNDRIKTLILADRVVFQDNPLYVSADGGTVRFDFQWGGGSPTLFSFESRGLRPYDPKSQTKLAGPVVESPHIKVTDWRESREPRLNEKRIRIYPHETSRSYAITPDGFEVLLGTSRYLRLLTKENEERWKVPVEHTVKSITVSGDGKLAVVGLANGTLNWFRMTDGKLLVSLFPHGDGKRWVMWTPEGYFDASPGAEELVGYHLNQGKEKEGLFISFKQLYDVFYRPDIVVATLRGEDISSLVTVTAEQALRNPPPQVSFTQAPPEGTREKAKVCYRIVSAGGGIGEVRLFQNGKLLRSDGYYRQAVRARPETLQLATRNGKTLYAEQRGLPTQEKALTPTASPSKGDTFDECTEIDPIPGENEVGLLAFNRDNTVHSHVEMVRFTSNRTADEPHLYILAVGINRFTSPVANLKYAAKDAIDFRQKMAGQSLTLYRPEHIHAEILTDTEASKQKILAKIDALSTVIKATDEFVLFVASHGVLIQNQYFIITHDYEGTLKDTCLISSNEIIEMSKKIRALSQLFVLDTCHAGGVDTVISGLYDARLSVLAKKAGLHVYASANTLEEAIDGYRENGLFTHTLLKGLDNEKSADINGDKWVSVEELGSYAKSRTAEISTKMHHSQIPLIISFGKDSFVYALR
jgi:WD40 repeat protein